MVQYNHTSNWECQSFATLLPRNRGDLSKKVHSPSVTILLSMELLINVIQVEQRAYIFSSYHHIFDDLQGWELDMLVTVFLAY